MICRPEYIFIVYKDPLMKKIIVFLAILLLFQQCSQNDPIENQSKPKITFSLSSPTLSSGRIKSGGITGVSRVVISLTTSSGEEVMTRQRINVSAFGDGFITDPVELEAGHYKVADFFLVDDTGSVLYASPHKGSFLGKLLKHPLNQEFAVVRNKNTNLDVEVVSVEGMSPEDFGYKSFSIKALEFFALSVHIITNGKPAFTKAEAFVLKGSDTLSANNLSAGINLIKFNSDVNDTCELVVIKDGYGRYMQKFTLAALKASLNNKPLSITLQPAFTFRFINNGFSMEDFDGFASLLFDTEVRTLYTLDWGDGTIEEFSQLGESSTYHYYPYGKEYFVSITGEIGKLTGFSIDPSIWSVYNLNVNALSGLKSLNFYLAGPQDKLDLRYNTLLENLTPSGDTLILPKVNNLRSIYLNQFMGCIQRGQLAQIVDNIHKNAVAHNTYNGRFFYSDTAYDPDPESTWSGNQKFMNQLRELQDKYHWWVLPRVVPQE